LYVQQKPFAQIVHIQIEWVIGPLFDSQKLNSFPGQRRLFVSSGRRTVTVVQKYAEQRRRSLHRAAALRKRQRGMLMPQQFGQ
jgi:hypothetical protein